MQTAFLPVVLRRSLWCAEKETDVSGENPPLFLLEKIPEIITVFLIFSKDEQKFSLLCYDNLHNEEILWEKGTFGEKFRLNKKELK